MDCQRKGLKKFFFYLVKLLAFEGDMLQMGNFLWTKHLKLNRVKLNWITAAASSFSCKSKHLSCHSETCSPARRRLFDWFGGGWRRADRSRWMGYDVLPMGYSSVMNRGGVQHGVGHADLLVFMHVGWCCTWTGRGGARTDVWGTRFDRSLQQCRL